MRVAVGALFWGLCAVGTDSAANGRTCRDNSLLQKKAQDLNNLSTKEAVFGSVGTGEPGLNLSWATPEWLAPMPSFGRLAYDPSHCTGLTRQLWRVAFSLLGGTVVQEISCPHISMMYVPTCLQPESCVSRFKHIDEAREEESTGCQCNRIDTYARATVAFERIWKNANNAIRCNLDVLKQRAAASQHQAESSRNSNRTQLHFAMIRHPLERFVSSYSEAEYRNSAVYPFTSKEGVDRARAFVLDLIKGSFVADGDAFMHMRVQISTIQKYQPQYVWQLSNMSEAWQAVQDAVGIESPWLDSCGTHAMTDKNSNNAHRAYMQSFVDEDANVRLALTCAVLLPDMVCLGYEIDEAACVSAGFADSIDSWKQITATVKTAHCPTEVHFVTQPSG